jgi:predicted PurR-regulated permease PerM
VTTSIGPVAQSVLAGVVNLLVQFGMALLIFFFMISAALALPTPSRLGLDPNAPAIERVTSLTGDVQKYMTVLTGINLLVGLGDTILLLILGVDYALLWGLLAWFMGYIPSIGFWIALIPPVPMAYAQFGLPTALVVLVAYVLINGGVQNIVQPKLMGQSLKISPVVVFVGLFIWGYLLGGIGAILAVPMTLLVLVIMENFEGTGPLAILMRYTGEEKEEREAAARHIKGLWVTLIFPCWVLIVSVYILAMNLRGQGTGALDNQTTTFTA